MSLAELPEGSEERVASRKSCRLFLDRLPLGLDSVLVEKGRGYLRYRRTRAMECLRANQQLQWPSGGVLGDNLLESSLLVFREMKDVHKSGVVVNASMNEVDAAAKMPELLFGTALWLCTTKACATDAPCL